MNSKTHQGSVKKYLFRPEYLKKITVANVLLPWSPEDVLYKLYALLV